MAWWCAKAGFACKCGGRHFDAATRHEAAPANTEAELHYRGTVYHHNQAEAARQVRES